MKRLIIILLTIILIILPACGNKDNDNINSSKEASSVTEALYVSSEAEPQSSPASSDTVTPSSSSAESTVSSISTTPSAAQSSQAPSYTPIETVKVTVPEGYSFMQIAELLESKGVCSKKDFFSAAQSYTVKSFTITTSSDRVFRLEGYLYPDTYEFYKPDEPVNVIIKMLNNYAAKSGMPSDKTLILASIIEKEARSSKHMKMVSSVFHNRLDAGMNLGSDPTREYINKYVTNNPLLSNTSKYAELYNTYKCKGLPAGPICSPGKTAIDAAKNPSASEYYYFFFGNDNDNHYSKTLEEHERQMQQYGVQFG